MKKFFLVLAAVLLTASTSAFAQQSFLPGSNPNFKHKDFYAGAHLGLGGGVYGGIGPVVNVEYGVLSNIGITGSVGYFGYSEAFLSTTWTYNIIPIIVGANYHFDLLNVSKLDTWVGVGLGYTIGSWSSSDPTFTNFARTGSYFTWDGRLGARYYLSNNLAIKAELGYWALGYLRLGVDFKL
jgi:hypothetical protein